jgi:hypothetical protein
MKKHSKPSKTKSANKTATTTRPKVIKELAAQFEADLNKTLPISIQPDGSIVYKEFYIKENQLGNWGLYHLKTKDEVDQYYLKTCALMAARAYSRTSLERFFEIKRLDNQYWANHCDSLIYKRNIKLTKDNNRYLVLLNKLEHSEFLAGHYKEKISTMFKWTFV